jgi:hypothetical protein
MDNSSDKAKGGHEISSHYVGIFSREVRKIITRFRIAIWNMLPKFRKYSAKSYEITKYPPLTKNCEEIFKQRIPRRPIFQRKISGINII